MIQQESREISYRDSNALLNPGNSEDQTDAMNETGNMPQNYNEKAKKKVKEQDSKFKSTLLLNFNASNTVLNTDKGLTLDDAFVRAGGLGKFQLFLLIFYGFTITCASYTLYNIDPLTEKPDYLCLDEATNEWTDVDCDAETICASFDSDEPITYKIDWDSVDSLDNWVFKLDLMCVPDEKAYRISQIYYIGEMVGGLSITRIPDVFGRKWPLAILATIQVPVFYFAVIFSHSLTLTTVLAFFLGFFAYRNIQWMLHQCVRICRYQMEKQSMHIDACI